MKALDEMGDFLSRRDSARDVENVAKSLGSAIGNVVDASIKSYQKAANGTSPVADPVGSLVLSPFESDPVGSFLFNYLSLTQWVALYLTI